MDNNNLSDELVKSILEDRKQERKWRIIRSVTNIIIFVIFAIIIINILSLKNPLSVINPLFTIKTQWPDTPGSNFSANVIPQLKAFRTPSLLASCLRSTPRRYSGSISADSRCVERLKKQYNKKVIVVGRDLLTSGAYLISTAADKIYVNKDTSTGSIGVICHLTSMALSKTTHKRRIHLPIEKRQWKKDSLDPFLPLTNARARFSYNKKLNQTLERMHADFIDYVKEGEKTIRISTLKTKNCSVVISGW